MPGTNATIFGSSIWYHVLVTISSADKVNFYINGVLTGTANQTLSVGISGITTTNVMRIGNRSGGTDRSLNAGARGVKMWNIVLTQAEITQEAAGTDVATPIHWFKLGGDYTDYGSLGLNGTNSGSVVSSKDGTIGVILKAARTGATDKYLLDEVNGKILSAVINET